MAACCRSVYIPQIVASHHTVSTIFCDASLLPVMVQSPQSVCCIVLLTLCIIILRSRHDYQKNVPCGMIKVCFLIELNCCVAGFLPGLHTETKSSVMPACCQSHKVHNLLLCQLVASHHIQSTICCDASLLPVIIQSPQCYSDATPWESLYIITIYLINLSGKLKLSFDRKTKNISQ